MEVEKIPMALNNLYWEKLILSQYNYFWPNLVENAEYEPINRSWKIQNALKVKILCFSFLTVFGQF